MTTTWTLVANRAGARLYETRGPATTPELVEELEHPEGRKKAGEIDTDRSGEVSQSAEHGRRSMDREVDPTEKVAQDFAAEIADHLDHPRAQGKFDRLVLVAPPSFLGLLREKLSDPTAALVEGSVPKDLPRVRPEELRGHVEHEVLI